MSRKEATTILALMSSLPPPTRLSKALDGKIHRKITNLQMAFSTQPLNSLMAGKAKAANHCR